MLRHTILSGLMITTLAASPAGQGVAAEYSIDTGGTHAFILFSVSHLGFSNLHGRFNDFDGSFNWDQDDPGSASVEITVRTASIDTGHEERDDHLRSPDFLDTDSNPTAHFVSTGFDGDASGGMLTGDLTLNGVTRPVDIEISVIGEGKDPWGGYRAGFSGEMVLQGADFEFGSPMFPQTIHMTLSMEGIQQ